MPEKKYEINLTESDINILKSITHRGSTSSARTIMHANILLNTNDGESSEKRTIER